jgi:hypothetical protein
LNNVVLVSPGGDVDEALKIGRLFRKYLISTIAPTDLGGGSTYLSAPECKGQNCGTCASACALIWFGGVERTGTVGAHRPQINDATFAGLSPADASNRYRRLLARITAYLEEMEVPNSITEAMVATSSGDIRWVDAIDDNLQRPPSTAEWVDASCGARGPYLEEIKQNTLERLSPQRRSAIERQYRDNLSCEGLLFDKYIDQMPRP